MLHDIDAVAQSNNEVYAESIVLNDVNADDDNDDDDLCDDDQSSCQTKTCQRNK